ncbi:hypothetical protein EIP86_009775 [Pleurotus ostreatoroseus]|nr:hypothetical protein EIP86_009775 [Pleurotus ostreatoroseus]
MSPITDFNGPPLAYATGATTAGHPLNATPPAITPTVRGPDEAAGAGGQPPRVRNAHYRVDSAYGSVSHSPTPPTPGPQSDARPPLALICPALHTATYPEPALRGCIPIRVVPRGGIVGQTDKVEWRLFAQPAIPISTGSRVALLDATGEYRFISRTVGPVIGADQRWVTFILSSGISAPASTQVLSVPRGDAGIPLFLRVLLFLFAWYLADEHPFAPTPVPNLD